MIRIFITVFPGAVIDNDVVLEFPDHYSVVSRRPK